MINRSPETDIGAQTESLALASTLDQKGNLASKNPQNETETETSLLLSFIPL